MSRPFRFPLLAVLTLGFAWLGGCAATSPDSSSTVATAPADGRDSYDPQVIIRANDPGRVRGAAIALVSEYGGKLVRATPDQLLFSKAGKAAGNSADPAPVYFVRLTLSPAGPGRVRASASGRVNGPRPAELSEARARTFLMAGLLRLQAAVEASN